MRMLSKLLVTTAAVATVTAMAAGPALADPPNGVVPKETDVVGVGSDTLEFVMDQFSFDFNKSHKGTKLYSWDALNPVTGMTDNIVTKSGCAAIPRPDGSSAGISTLILNTKTADGTAFCVDYARSSRPRASTDPAFGPGGIAFVALGTDGVTWAANATTNAPSNLTTAQLNGIYSCTITNWNQVGGKSGAINAQLPQTSSGTRKFFLTAIGVTTPGSCVNSTAQENEGIDPVLAGPNTIFPYSIGKYIAEKFHSAKCLNSTCTGNPACTPKVGQNKFGCDTHGSMVLKDINGTVPTTGTGSKTVINKSFSPAFLRTIFNVVRWASTADNIPSYLDKFFGAKGWICTSSAAKTDLLHYGFLATPFCGIAS
jgi:ABC-type phosphate transport system substrate-binding protein